MKRSISQLETLDDQLFGSDNEEEDVDKRKTSLIASSSSSPKKSSDQADNGKNVNGSEGTEEILLVKKRKTRRQVNEADIAGDEGIFRIYEEFPSLCKFRGRGSEAHDLKQMINVYKEWCFQLYPSIAYEDVVEKILTFSSKSAVHSTLERLRQQECNRYMKDVLGIEPRYNPREDDDVPVSTAQRENRLEEFNWLAEYNEADWVDVGLGPPQDAPNPPSGNGAVVEMSDSEDEFNSPAPLVEEVTADPEPEQTPSSSSSASTEKKSQRKILLDDDDDDVNLLPPPHPTPAAAPTVLGTRDEEWSE